MLLDATPKLLEVVKVQCWRRLTDDMRLAFYRDLFVQASSKLEEEQLRVRMEAALQLWRSHEPRRRIARWKLFVADRKLFRRSDVHFRTVSSRKVVAALDRQRARRQQMRDMAAIASVKYCGSLLLWTLQSWQLYVHSMQLLCVRYTRSCVATSGRPRLTTDWRDLHHALYLCCVLDTKRRGAAVLCTTDACGGRRRGGRLSSTTRFVLLETRRSCDACASILTPEHAHLHRMRKRTKRHGKRSSRRSLRLGIARVST